MQYELYDLLHTEDPSELPPALLCDDLHLPSLLQLAVNMQDGDAAAELLEFVYNHPLSSPELTAVTQLLWPGFEAAVHTRQQQQQQQEQHHAHQPEEQHIQQPVKGQDLLQQEQRSQQHECPEAFYKQLLRVAVLRGHCDVVEKLRFLPTAASLTPGEIEALLQQVVQCYRAQKDEWGRAEGDSMLAQVLNLPRARRLTPQSLVALMHAALHLQDKAAAEDALKRLAGTAAARTISPEQLLAIAESVLQRGWSCFPLLLRLAPAAQLSSEQVLQLLHSAIREYMYAANRDINDEPEHQKYALHALCAAPTGLRVDAAAAAALMLTAAQLGQARLLASLAERLPAAKQLTPATIQQLLLMCVTQRNMSDWRRWNDKYDAVEGLRNLPAAAKLLGVEVQRLLAAAVQVGDDDMLGRLMWTLDAWLPEVDNTALLQLAIELGRNEEVKVRA
jgi:hypothetical protein